MLGQSEKILSNYEHMLTFWHMVDNPALKEQASKKKKKKKKQQEAK